MFSPFQSIIDGSFLTFFKSNKNITIYSDIASDDRDIPTGITVLPLESLIKGGKDPSHTNNKSSVICITMKLTHKEILKLDKRDIIPKVRLSLHAGIMSIIHKYDGEDDDITRMLSQGYQVAEPYDKASFIDLLQQKEGYIRIIDTFIPDSITKSHNKHQDYIMVNEHEHYHDEVIIIGGSSIASVMQSITLGNKDNHTTLIAQGGRTISIDNPKVIDHISNASHITIIIEHKATEAIWMYYDVLIKQYNPTIQISYIFPQYHLITSILPEYIYELAGFDAERIAAYIIND